MATTQAHLKTVADGPTDEHTGIDLNEIVAQTTLSVGTLPDFDVFNAACHATRDTLERITEEVA